MEQILADRNQLHLLSPLLTGVKVFTQNLYSLYPWQCGFIRILMASRANIDDIQTLDSGHLLHNQTT